MTMPKRRPKLGKTTQESANKMNTVFDLRLQGLNEKQIAKKMNIAKSLVINLLFRLRASNISIQTKVRLYGNAKQDTRARRLRLIELMKEPGMTTVKAAKLLEVNTRAVSKDLTAIKKMALEVRRGGAVAIEALNKKTRSFDIQITNLERVIRAVETESDKLEKKGNVKGVKKLAASVQKMSSNLDQLERDRIQARVKLNSLKSE